MIDPVTFYHNRQVIQGFQNRLYEEFRDLSENGKPIPHELMTTMALCQIAVAQELKEGPTE